MRLLDFLKKDGRDLDRKRESLILKVVAYLDHHNLSTIPSVLAKIMEVGRNPNATVGDYARLYEMDQSSCMRLLVLANSVYYGARTGAVIRNVEEAIVRVGMRRAQEVINSSIVAGLFKSSVVIEDYSTTDLWLNSVAVAVGNRVLCAALPAPPPGGGRIDPYLAGLLHDVGISIEHQCFYQDGFREAVESRARGQGLLLDEEARHLSVTHAELGMEIAHRWKMPEELAAVLGHHHDLAVDGPEPLRLLHVTRTAQWIAYELRLGYSDFGDAQAPEYLASRRALGLDDARYAKVKEQVSLEIQRLKDLGWFSALKVRHV
jgi:HD-like signal output (HDOD) protein